MVELLISNLFQGYAVRDDTAVVVIFTLQTIEKAKCAVGVQFARSIVNGLVH